MDGFCLGKKNPVITGTTGFFSAIYLKKFLNRMHLYLFVVLHLL